jgi:hypothetical protein
MKYQILFFVLFTFTIAGKAQEQFLPSPAPGYEYRIRSYVDSLRIIDTHEHLFTPDLIKNSYFLDFMLLFQQNSYNDLVSAGMPDTMFNALFNDPLTPLQKWKIIEPYWKNSFNTSFNRVILLAIKNLYGISDLNESTVLPLSEKIERAYNTDWFDRILRDSCRIDYIIQDGYYQPGKDDYFRYAKRFDDWILVKSKYRIDSLAISQLDPIFTLEGYVKSMRLAFENAVKKGMTVVKVFIAYSRTLGSEKVETEAARKVFRSLVNGNEDYVIAFKDAKPLQDYMFYQLLGLAEKYKLPVAVHTGLQAGKGNFIGNSNPTLLTNAFNAFPDVKFVLYHGSYPFGGELSTLAKNFNNVYIDMNWTYSISPEYTERYLNEWLETVPANKLMAFGGDFMVPEDVYGELIIAKQIISKVLSNKVREGYLSESEAKIVAKMILFDNASKLYNLH